MAVNAVGKQADLVESSFCETRSRLSDTAVIFGALGAIAGFSYYFGTWGAVGACATCGATYLIHSYFCQTSQWPQSQIDAKTAAVAAPVLQSGSSLAQLPSKASRPLSLPSVSQSVAPPYFSKPLTLPPSAQMSPLAKPVSNGAWIKQKMQQFSCSGAIYFYDHTNPATEWLGNFYEIPIQFNGLTFRNAEAAFQAQKFIHSPQFMKQFTTLSGEQAFQLARDCRTFVRPDWMQVNVQTMRSVLHAKTIQHSEIAEWLKATGTARLVEHNPIKGRDAFWSDDFDGSGQNMLGQLWMSERSFLYGS